MNNQPFRIPLQQSLAAIAVDGAVTLTIKLRQTDSTVPINIWMSPVTSDNATQSLWVDAAPASAAPVISLLDLDSQTAGAIIRVYKGPEMDIYELPNPRPYFEASDTRCKIALADRQSVNVDCPAAASLLRREAYYPGWSAYSDGNLVAIQRAKDLFQLVPIPAGAHHITFRYRPSHLLLITTAFGLATIFWLVSFVFQLIDARRRHALTSPN
jgi:hypothetical protein